MRALLVLCLLGLTTRALAEDSFHVHEAGQQVYVVERARSDGLGVEGFVVDKTALVQTLRSRVLEVQGLGNLAHVTAAAEPGGYAKSATFAGAYTFKHRFSDPFGAVEARLDLAPLDDEGAFDLLFQLSALLVVAVIAGLFALYRMVAVQVRFAERRSNFVAAVSHELKTPLTAIRLYAEMLRDDMVEHEDKRREYYATITSETERLSRLINNVLELSRLEQRERPVQMVVGDVARLAEEVVEVFRPHAQREGFRVEVEAQAGLPSAHFDRDALTQVLFNLLDNALKYGRGAAERVICVRCTRGAQDRVHVSVSDRGPGVDESQLGAIFQPFYRAQSELTRTQQGTGIGLALVRGLVQRMRGQVEGRNCKPGFEVTVTLQLAP